MKVGSTEAVAMVLFNKDTVESYQGLVIRELLQE